MTAETIFASIFVLGLAVMGGMWCYRLVHWSEKQLRDESEKLKNNPPWG